MEIDGFTVAEYAYDAFERRVLKIVNGVTTHFHYDLNGLLISETGGNGNPRKDYVYLTAAMKAYGGSAGWYWFVNDHLGTPQKMVDESGTPWCGRRPTRRSGRRAFTRMKSPTTSDSRAN